MTYDQAIEQINSLLRFGMKPGLENIQKLLAVFGNPQDSLKFIHVAGTNGKGSTCMLIASVLKKSRYKVGMYTSPYVTDFCERIQVGGSPIPHRDLIRLVEDTMPVVKKLETEGTVITEFEFITALGFRWFLEQNCDVVVLEVGLGGRLDATNVIKTPLLSVIAHIDLDHMAILGDTVEKIAYEKCGIIKEGGVTVCYPDQYPGAMGVIRKTAEERHNKLLVADPSELQVFSEHLSGTALGYRGMLLNLPLLGAHQIKNAATALTALAYLQEELHMHITEHSFEAGFSISQVPARVEVIKERPLCIVDGGHNPDGMAALADTLKKLLPGKRLVAVTGMLGDKDVDSAIANLKDVFQEVVTLPIHNPRAMDPKELAEHWERLGIPARVGEYPEQAIAMAVDLAGKDGGVVICGSLYLAGEVRKTAQDLLRLLTF